MSPAGLLVLLAVALPAAMAHTMNLGPCPTVEPVPNFDMEKFMGQWYVIQKFSTASACMTYNFTRGDDGKLRIQQSRQHFLLDAIGVGNQYVYTGVLSVPDPSEPARMKVKFPLNVAGNSDYTVFMTDYNTYAGIFSCQRILFGHLKSASILSRQPELDPEIVTKIRNRLERSNIDSHDFNIVEQLDCQKDGDANIRVNINDKTFSAQNIGSVVKDGLNAAGEAVGKAGDFIGKGIEKLGDKKEDVREEFEEKTVTPLKPIR